MSDIQERAAPTGANLKSGNAVLTATIHITRAKTGKVETYQIVGTPVEDKDKENGSHTPVSV